MLKSPAVSQFQAVRRKWEETQKATREESTSKPLVTSKSIGDTNTTSAAKDKPNRLASLSMFNKSLISLKSRNLTRSRPPSSSNEASASTVTLTGNSDSWNPVVPPSSPLTMMRASIPQSGPQQVSQLARSQTASFLPLPAKPVTTSPEKQPQLVHSRTTSLFRSRIPTPPRRQPNYIPRSNTQPNLVPAAVAPRKASELTRPRPRFGATEWQFSEDSRPLLEATRDGDCCTSRRSISEDDESLSRSSQEQQPFFPRRVDSLPQHSRTDKGKENACEPSARNKMGLQHRHSQHVIQCHTLLQPIQPLSPSSTATALSEFPPPHPAFFDAPGQTPIPLQRKRQSFPVPTLIPIQVFNTSSDPAPAQPEPEPEPEPEPKPEPETETETETEPAPKSPAAQSLPSLTSYKYITTPQPTSYWAGRFTSLNDNLLNESFNVENCLRSPGSIASETDSNTSFSHSHHPAGSASQALHIFNILDSACVTTEANHSLVLFRNMYAIANKMPFLKMEAPMVKPLRPVLENKAPHRTASEPGLLEINGLSKGVGGAFRKISFMDRLRGRKGRLSSGTQ